MVAIGLTQLQPGPPLRVPGTGFGAEVGLLTMAAVALMLSLTFTAENGPGWLLLAPAAVPFHLQRAVGAAPAEIGLTMLAFPLGTTALGVIGGALTDRFTARRVTGVGAVVVAVGVALMIPIGSDWAMAELSWRLALIGAGAGLLAGPSRDDASSIRSNRGMSVDVGRGSD